MEYNLIEILIKISKRKIIMPAKPLLTDREAYVIHEMKEIGLTQKTIAQAFGVSQPTISNILAKPKPEKPKVKEYG